MAYKKITINGNTGSVDEKNFTSEENTARQNEETTYANNSANRKLLKIKMWRNEALQETDWYSNSDVTMPDNIKTWRQSLRDIPTTYTTEEKYDELLLVERDRSKENYGIKKHSIWTKPS